MKAHNTNRQMSNKDDSRKKQVGLSGRDLHPAIIPPYKKKPVNNDEGILKGTDWERLNENVHPQQNPDTLPVMKLSEEEIMENFDDSGDPNKEDIMDNYYG